MLKTFWSELGSIFGKRWLMRSFIPALIFWSLSLWMAVAPVGVGQALVYWSSLAGDVRTLLAVVALVVVTFTGYLLDLTQSSLTRLYEGYGWGVVGRWLTRRALRKRDRLAERRKELAAKKEPSAEDRGKLIALDNRLQLYYPVLDEAVLPTQLGNVMAAAEEYPRLRYGLDASLFWPRLYFSLPDALRQALAEARDGMEMLLRISFLLWLWMAIWGPVTLVLRLYALAVICLLGGVLGWLCYRAALIPAARFGDLIRTAFDRCRFDMYAALHWPLPVRPGEEERAHGERLAQFLYRGYPPEDVTYSSGD